MVVELISRTENRKLGLTARVEVADLGFPKSSEQMSDLLTKHALECRHCLAAILYCEETLAEAGCEDYKKLLAKMRSELQLRASLDPISHVHEDILEEYCFNRLSPEEAQRLESHVNSCPDCQRKLEHRPNFIYYMKAALALQEREELADDIGGVLGIHCPDLEFSLCVPIQS